MGLISRVSSRTYRDMDDTAITLSNIPLPTTPESTKFDNAITLSKIPLPETPESTNLHNTLSDSPRRQQNQQLDDTTNKDSLPKLSDCEFHITKRTYHIIEIVHKKTGKLWHTGCINSSKDLGKFSKWQGKKFPKDLPENCPYPEILHTMWINPKKLNIPYLANISPSKPATENN